MPNLVELFEKNKYVELPKLLHIDNCIELTNILKELVSKGLTTQDEQCPKSEAIYGNITFDSLLKDLLPHIEIYSGKKLHPTYSYARLYKPGEELKVHRDRGSCEISVTLTLGFKGKPWAIYMGDHKDKSNATEIYMNVGDAVLYRGMEKWHWREKFEGEWQAQVFLHYVDANGPHAEHKMDKRDNLGKGYIGDILPDYIMYPNHITKEYCSRIEKEYIKKTYDKLKPEIEGGRVDTSIRNVERLMLPTIQGIGSTLTAVGINTNYNHWKYNVTHSHQCEFLHYQAGGKYVSHTDTRHSHTGAARKLTVLLFLNDDFEGGKFYIQTGHKKEYPQQDPGTIIVFPSYMLHGVEPVTKGTRNAIVCWMEGPYFK